MTKKCRKCKVPLEGFLYRLIAAKLFGVRPSDKDPELCNKCEEKKYKIPFIDSRPSQFLMFTSFYIVTIGLVLPFIPLGKYFGFVQPPPMYLLSLLIIILVYLFRVQLVKAWFIKRYGYE